MKSKESLEKFRIPLPSFMDVPLYEESDEYGYYSTGAQGVFCGIPEKI